MLAAGLAGFLRSRISASCHCHKGTLSTGRWPFRHLFQSWTNEVEYGRTTAPNIQARRQICSPMLCFLVFSPRKHPAQRRRFCPGISSGKAFGRGMLTDSLIPGSLTGINHFPKPNLPITVAWASAHPHFRKVANVCASRGKLPRSTTSISVFCVDSTP